MIHSKLTYIEKQFIYILPILHLASWHSVFNPHLPHMMQSHPALSHPSIVSDGSVVHPHPIIPETQ